MAHRWHQPRLLRAAMTVTLMALTTGCASCKTVEEEKPEPATLDSVREACKVEDRGHGAFVLAYFEALGRGDSAAANAMLTDYARNEIALQHESFDRYVAKSKTLIAAEGPARIEFAYPWKLRYSDGAPMDNGEFFAVRLNEQFRFVVFIVDEGGKLRIDNLLVKANTRLFVFDRIVPAFGLQLDTPQMAFYAYHYGAIFGEHIRNVLDNVIGDPMSDKERMAYLRLCSTKQWIDAIKKLPEYRGDMLGFLNTGKSALADFGEPISVGFGEKDLDIEITKKHPPVPSKVRYNFIREHGVFRIVSEGIVYEPAR
ncbi:MAG: hypothetical protein HUU29_11005 [Planctomycetaceae bacterium]|nr:hypothetical protein [Planctomycetaceae bacterium]